VVLFDGMDNCKEMSVLFAGLEFASRGFKHARDRRPGQGETLRLRKLYARHDYEVAGTAAYEFVASAADVNPLKVVVMGYSFGATTRRASPPSRRATRRACAWRAALGPARLAAQDQGAAARRPRKSAQSNFQFQSILGLNDSDEALERAKAFFARRRRGRR